MAIAIVHIYDPNWREVGNTAAMTIASARVLKEEFERTHPGYYVSIE